MIKYKVKKGINIKKNPLSIKKNVKKFANGEWYISDTTYRAIKEIRELKYK